jgi:hypothetical protein
MPPEASTISFTIAIFNRIASNPPRHRVLFEKSHQNSHRLNCFSTEGSPPIMPLHVNEEYKLVTDIECQERVHSVYEIENIYRYMCSINNRNPPPPPSPKCSDPGPFIWGTMTFVIFITNARGCYCRGGGGKKKLPARARRILIKNLYFFSNSFHGRWCARASPKHSVHVTLPKNGDLERHNDRTTPDIISLSVVVIKLYAGRVINNTTALGPTQRRECQHDRVAKRRGTTMRR